MMHKIAYRLLILSAFFVITEDAAAQKTITFETSNRPSLLRKNKHQSDKKNSLTLGILSPLEGYIPVYYERALLPWLSIQAGAGITMRSLSNDLGEMLAESDAPYAPDNDVPQDYYHYGYRSSKIGTYFSVAPRIYVRQNVMDGIFISPMIELKHFAYSAQKVDISQTPDQTIYYKDDDSKLPRISDTQPEHMNCVDMTFNVGGHYQPGNHMAIGWIAGFGIRSLSEQRLDVHLTTTNNIDYKFENGVRNFSSMRFLLNVGLTVGGCF